MNKNKHFAFALCACTLMASQAFAVPVKLGELSLPPAVKLGRAEAEIGSWIGLPVLSAVGFSRFATSYPMAKALGPLRKSAPMSFHWFLDSEIVEKYPGDPWSTPQKAFVCGVKWTRDDFMRNHPDAVLTNGMVRLENADGRIFLDEYWYVAFSADGNTVSIGESPEIARAALESSCSNSVPDDVVAELSVGLDGIRKWAPGMLLTNRLAKLSGLNASLRKEPDGLCLSADLLFGGSRESADFGNVCMGDNPLAFAPRNAIVAHALSPDVADDGILEFCDRNEFMAALKASGIDISSVRVSEGPEGSCNVTYGAALLLQCLEKMLGFFGEEKDAELVARLLGVKRVHPSGAPCSPIFYSNSIEGCKTDVPASVRFNALFPEISAAGRHGAGFVYVYAMLKAALCECVSVEDASLRSVLLAAIDALPPFGGGVAWMLTGHGTGMSCEVKMSRSEIKGLSSWLQVYCALLQMKADVRSRLEALNEQDGPVDVAERLVSCGNLTGAVEVLERAPTNDCETCYRIGDFYGTNPELPTQRVDMVNLWMERAYRLADESDKRRIACRCANGFVDKNDDYPADDKSARLWLQRAADAGSAYWQCRLADSYAQGYFGFKRDGAKALMYLEMAEMQRHLKTHHVRATMYKDGIGLPKDIEKAFECLSLGIKRGSTMCPELYAAMLIYGRGGDERRSEGFSLMQRILERGKVGSSGYYCLRMIGLAYECGYGVEKDVGKAIEYYRQSAAQGDKYSKRRLKALAEQ